jgi:hypothetical protein
VEVGGSVASDDRANRVPEKSPLQGIFMTSDEQRDQHLFHAVSGFRMSVPPDRPDLLLLELKTLDADIVRLSMTKESARLFGQEVAKAAAE